MKEQRIAIIAVIVLALLGIAGIGLRIRAMRQARLAVGDTVWRVTYDIAVAGRRKAGVRIHVALPYDTPQARLFRETFTRSGLWTDVLVGQKTRGREVVAVALNPSEPARFLAELDIHVSPRSAPLRGLETEVLSAKARMPYLRTEKLIQVRDPRVMGVLTALTQRKMARSELLTHIFEHCSETIAMSRGYAPADAATALQEGTATTVGRARAMVALCRASGMPARLVTGFVLENVERANAHTWVEVYDKKSWAPYDPGMGYAGEVPPNYLPVCRNGTAVVRASKGAQCQVKYSIRPIPPSSEAPVPERRQFVDVAFLTRLPYGMQQTLAILLLLPLGALITSVFRNLIGVQTFGTFTPSLLALSFIHADWRMGIIVFVLVVGIGLSCRALLLERMKLLMVPRLSVVLTLVILALTTVISVLGYFRLTPSARAVLLPMVIVTMMIERFHVSAEEDGHWYALKLLAGTLAVAFCCFVLLRWNDLGRLVLSFPEGNLVVAALLILLGRYTGYRLTELRRLRDIARTQNTGDGQ